MNTRKLALAIILLGLSTSSVLAADVAGYVRALHGDAYLTVDGQRSPAAADAPVSAGTRIETGSGASLGIVFKDNTVLSVGPGSALSLVDYAYAPSHGEFKLDATLEKGTLAYLAGAIAKQNPGGVMLKTPTGSVGVRGSHFAIKVDNQ
ncbi:hypothetical protein EZJ19_14165 [Parasulfuritortus cantonensis]|uniref:FecR protein domain-containing protein n=1 Tax=Parasulfuritortus cantonensis TaxID=2528202 RepID=A0A4R1B6D8_9PROT|nr:FecR domain-containing protein [Parasulfuritortus cantonensis]TCJ11798.1 hypothetical protein EZJ19_14165 [Parasulfuritortus cantonensis]